MATKKQINNTNSKSITKNNNSNSSSSNGPQDFHNNIIALQEPLLNRPARKQSNNINTRYEEHDVDSQDYNIWYGKKAGKRNWRDRDVSETRCNVLKDCGRTRAGKGAYFCQHFAKGRCVNGVDCTYLHRVPTPEDDKKLSLTYDIFGRERFKADRDDMGGVGTFSRDNRTLYISGIKSNQNAVALEDMIRRAFEEWGTIEYVRVVINKSIAFVRYMYRSTAEFAKIAMSDQQLDNGELLNVRWATEDSNPLAKQHDERNLHRVATEVVNKRLKEMTPDDNSALKFQMTGQYPNTDGQFDQNLLQMDNNAIQYKYRGSQSYEMHPYARQYNQRLKERQGKGEAEEIQPLIGVGNIYGHTPNSFNHQKYNQQQQTNTFDNMTEEQKKQYDEYLKSYYQYYGYDYSALTDEQKQQMLQYSQSYYGVQQPQESLTDGTSTTSTTTTTTTSNNENGDDDNNNDDNEDDQENDGDDDDNDNVEQPDEDQKE